MATIVRIGSARIDENGHISGGEAGNQNGKELREEDFYFHTKKWLAFKPRSIKDALALAQSMKDACANKNIGYDQMQRLGVYSWVNAGTKIKNIDHPTECDCSALVRACILEATGKNLANFNTSSEPSILKKSGLFEDAFEVVAMQQLETGMVIVTASKGHTAIVTEGKAPTGSTEKPVVKPENKEDMIIDASAYYDKSLKRRFHTTAQLNLRTGAGTMKPIIAVMPFDAEVTCYGYYNRIGTDKWLCVKFNDMTGYCSEKYLK